MTERGKDISITIAVCSVFYGNSDAHTESSTEREREGLQVRVKWLARVAGV